MQEAQRGVERAVEVLEEERLAVQRVDGDMVSAVAMRDAVNVIRETRVRELRGLTISRA